MCMYTATDLYCDDSGGSIGAVLQQTDRDGNVRPVDFYSRKPTPAEGRYGTYDRELVGLRDGSVYLISASWCSLHGPHKP
jgi:hypothetical protein